MKPNETLPFGIIRARRGLPPLNRRRPMWPALVACLLSWAILAAIICYLINS